MISAFDIIPNNLTKLKWVGYSIAVPYIYVMVMVDEEQEKVLEVHRKYEALRVVRACKYPFRPADPEGDQRIIIAQAIETARMKEIGKKV